MADEKTVVDTLNELRARELAVIMQYMRHHYIVTGAEGLSLEGEFKSVAIAEMKHAEMLAERIDFLGGNPTTQPSAFSTAETDLAAMAAADLAAEDTAVELYRGAIARVEAAGDVTTRRMLEEILAQEEDHQNTFARMIGR